MAELADALAALTAPERVSTRPPDRAAYARDLWPRGLIEGRDGAPPAHRPDAIVWPRTVEEVRAIVRFAAEAEVPIVPFGAGSGVCGGTVPLRGGVVVDVKRMRRLLALDPRTLTATFECGIVGEHLEHELARRGYTLGHFPSSIMCSTLGGWLAARSAGQCSSRYGKIEDMVRAVEFVDGRGEVITTAPSRSGLDWNQLLVGSEGTLGIFTRATVAIRPAPEVRLMRGFAMPRLAAGCEAIRRVMQRGLRPSVMRLYDELDTMIAGRHRPDAATGTRTGTRTQTGTGADVLRRLIPVALRRTRLLNRAVDALLPRMGGGCLLVVGVEGDHALAEAEARATFREIEAAGGRDLGAEPGERWLAHRYDVSFNLPKMFAAGAFADTMEVAIPWDRLLDLYRAVKAAVAPHAFVMAHFSHAYSDGCSIYFTFAATAEGEAAERYDTIWRLALAAATHVGATISHHHGVGMSKAAFMPDEHGASLAVYRALKRVLDPAGIFNPGKMGLEAAPPSAERAGGDLAAAVGDEHVEAGGRVVRPGAAAEVAAVVRAARAGGLTVGVGGRAGGVTIDPSRMREVLHLDDTSLLVHAQAGITLGALEERLVARGMTLEPLPRRTLARTVGAALAAPRPSEATPRGRLLDACAAVDAVLADGTVIHTRLAPRRATGPDLAQALLGARGATGIITAAWLRCARLPAARAFAGFAFSDGAAALAAARALLDRGARPADLSVAEADGGVLLALRLEGAPELVEAEAALAAAVAAAGRPVASSIAEAWLLGRGAAARPERFAATDDLAWRPGIEITAMTAAGAAVIGDGADAGPRAPLTEALAAALDPDHVFSTGTGA